MVREEDGHTHVVRVAQVGSMTVTSYAGSLMAGDHGTVDNARLMAEVTVIGCQNRGCTVATGRQVLPTPEIVAHLLAASAMAGFNYM